MFAIIIFLKIISNIIFLCFISEWKMLLLLLRKLPVDNHTHMHPPTKCRSGRSNNLHWTKEWVAQKYQVFQKRVVP